MDKEQKALCYENLEDLACPSGAVSIGTTSLENRFSVPTAEHTALWPADQHRECIRKFTEGCIKNVHSSIKKKNKSTKLIRLSGIDLKPQLLKWLRQED